VDWNIPIDVRPFLISNLKNSFNCTLIVSASLRVIESNAIKARRIFRLAISVCVIHSLFSWWFVVTKFVVTLPITSNSRHRLNESVIC